MLSVCTVCGRSWCGLRSHPQIKEAARCKWLSFVSVVCCGGFDECSLHFCPLLQCASPVATPVEPMMIMIWIVIWSLSRLNFTLWRPQGTKTQALTCLHSFEYCHLITTTLYVNHLKQHGDVWDGPTFSRFLVPDFLFPQPAIVNPPSFICVIAAVEAEPPEWEPWIKIYSILRNKTFSLNFFL